LREDKYLLLEISICENAMVKEQAMLAILNEEYKRDFAMKELLDKELQIKAE